MKTNALTHYANIATMAKEATAHRRQARSAKHPVERMVAEAHFIAAALIYNASKPSWWPAIRIDQGVLSA